MRITDLLQQGRGSDLLEEFAKASSSRDHLEDFQDLLGLTGPDELGAAVAQIDGREFADHVTPDVGGTNPLATLQPSDRATIAEVILGALAGAGAAPEDAVRTAGVGDRVPAMWEADGLARLAAYAQQNYPEAFGRVVGELRDRPNLLQRLLGSRAIQAMLVTLVTRMLTNRSGQSNA